MGDGEAVTRVDLSRASTDDLASELDERIVRDGLDSGFLSNPLFAVKRDLAILPCVDAIPVRFRGLRVPEMGFILRNTGFYKGRWWCIGGVIAKKESFSRALRRNVQETLGVGFSLGPGLSWNRPAYVGQYTPNLLDLERGEYAGHEPSKDCTSNTYLIELDSEDFKFGSTAHGGQEAGGFRWFPLHSLPQGDEIGYGGDDTVRECAKWIVDNLGSKN